MESLPRALADLDEAGVGADLDPRARRGRLARRLGECRRDGRRRGRGPAQRRVDDLERWRQRDRQDRRPGRPCEPRADEAGLLDAVGRQLGLRLALEAALDDERRLAVPDEDERRVEAGRDQAGRRSAGGGIGRQR
jgi:hypothetical protein